MSIIKIETLQGKISKKFKVYTSFQCQQGFDNKGKFYKRITVYDSIHSHREHKTLKDTVSELEGFLLMTGNEFKYDSAKKQAEYALAAKKEEVETLGEEIASLEEVLLGIEVAKEKSIK